MLRSPSNSEKRRRYISARCVNASHVSEDSHAGSFVYHFYVPEKASHAAKMNGLIIIRRMYILAL